MTRNSKKLNPDKQSDYKEENTHSPSPAPTAPERRGGSPFGISFVVPVETVVLPSRGTYYPSNHPLSGVETLEIRHMTAKEEDILSSSARKSVEEEKNTFGRLIDSLLVDEKINSTMLLEEDKMALLLAARATGYGAQYTTLIKCESCDSTVEQEFDLTKTTIIDPVSDSNFNPETNTFRYILPISKVELELENFSEEHEQQIQEDIKKKEKYNLPSNYTILFLQKVIISADSVTDRKLISQLIEVLPAADAKNIVKFYDHCRPVISTLQEVTCSRCKKQLEREAPFSWAFFRTDV